MMIATYFIDIELFYYI